MKIEATLEKIKDAVSRVQKISAKNLSLPILENILLIAEDNILILRSTNLHVGVEISIPVKIKEKGKALVNLNIFGQIINNLSGEKNIHFEILENTLSITTQNTKTQIKLFSDDDFPTLPRVNDGVLIKIPIDTISNGVKSVMYSASLSDIKPEISSVYIYKENNELVFVSTDSFRLSEKRIIIKETFDLPGIIIPIKNIQDCIKVFYGITDFVNFFIGKNQISIESSDIYFTSRIVDGNYPDYKQIIPKNNTTEVVVLKEELIQSLRLVNVFSDNFNQISLKINSKTGKINIHSRNTDIGENNVSIDASITGGDIEIYLNHKYLSDVFFTLHNDSISFSFTEENKPCVIRSIGDTSFLYLIMPRNR